MQAIGAGYGAYIPPLQHHRPPSLNPSPQPPNRGSVSKAKSTTALRSEAMLSAEHDNAFHTLQDPRTASTSDLSRHDLEAPEKDGVDMEVAALSDKLISAINHQQVLDDTLAQTRHELDAARKVIQELEAKSKDHEEKVARGQLLRRESFDRMQDQLRAELDEVKKEKSVAQQEKRGIEQELETLTASLFDEANKMVATANRERDTAEKNSQKLRDQLKDEEALIASQSEQLTELKLLMTEIQKDHRKDQLDSPRVSLGPNSPRAEEEDSNVARLMEAMDMEPIAANHGIVPSPATKFTHLLKPQFRTDVPAYDDFKSLIQSGEGSRSHNPSHAPSRAGSGSYGGLNVIGLGSMYGTAANTSSPNLSSQSTHSRTPSAQHAIPGSFSPNAEPKGVIALKDTRFFKRVMLEDVEPTLRLDTSPSISWLSRRSILSAFADSTLIVEPIPESTTKVYGRYTACSLCGESRKDVQNPRTHAMRVREGEGATKWPICVLCLEKVRAVGDLVTYIRMIRDGVVKCGDHREEIEAWEELIQMRERLFWARMAGGVVPSFVLSNKNSPVPGQTEQKGVGSSDLKQEHSGFATPAQTPRTSHDGSPEEQLAKQADLQLQEGMDEKLTTFENAKDYAPKRISLASGANSTPPSTPPRDKNGGIFTKMSMPKLPPGFWDSQVNTLS